MILQGYNPFQKLYSKCARSHASKLNYTNSQKQIRRFSGIRPSSSLVVSREAEKQKKDICTFDMYQSREQRQSKFRPGHTPSVGQYNPKNQSKAKLTWDILKVYNKKNLRKRPQSAILPHKQLVQTQFVQNSDGQKDDKAHQTQYAQAFISQPNAHQQEHNLRQKLSKVNTKIFSKSSQRYKNPKTSVNMTTMTGRQLLKSPKYSAQDSDFMNSIQFIKTKITKNINFKTQLSRQKVNSLANNLNSPSNYQCNYDFVKPKNIVMVDFRHSIGREVGHRKSLQSSDSNYDFNEYVWKGKSNVFTNTKKSVIDFKKQSIRNCKAKRP